MVQELDHDDQNVQFFLVKLQLHFVLIAALQGRLVVEQANLHDVVERNTQAVDFALIQDTQLYSKVVESLLVARRLLLDLGGLDDVDLLFHDVLVKLENEVLLRAALIHA